jgi:phosphatidylserine synthase
MLGLGLLMVSRFRYPHVVNQIVQGKQRVLRIVELGVFAVVLGMLRERALAVLFVAYAMVGPIGWVVWRLRRRGAVAEPAASAGQENAISP